MQTKRYALFKIIVNAKGLTDAQFMSVWKMLTEQEKDVAIGFATKLDQVVNF